MSQLLPKFAGIAHEVPSPSCQLVSKIGGAPVGLAIESWPVCRECGRHMDFLLQLDLRQPLRLSNSFAFAYLFMCHGYLDERDGIQCDTWNSSTGANQVVLVESPTRPEQDRNLGTKSWQEFALEYRPYRTHEDMEREADAKREALLDAFDGKSSEFYEVREGADEIEVIEKGDPADDLPQTVLIGGAPIWLQADETPKCPICQSQMKLLAQIHSEVRRWDSPGFPDGIHLPFGGGGVAYAFICERECSPKGWDLLWQCD